jgi:hypothetical protein
VVDPPLGLAAGIWNIQREVLENHGVGRGEKGGA